MSKSQKIQKTNAKNDAYIQNMGKLKKIFYKRFHISRPRSLCYFWFWKYEKKKCLLDVNDRNIKKVMVIHEITKE
jgi:hypothetical protein